MSMGGGGGLRRGFFPEASLTSGSYKALRLTGAGAGAGYPTRQRRLLCTSDFIGFVSLSRHTEALLPSCSAGLRDNFAPA